MRRLARAYGVRYEPWSAELRGVDPTRRGSEYLCGPASWDQSTCIGEGILGHGEPAHGRPAQSYLNDVARQIDRSTDRGHEPGWTSWEQTNRTMERYLSGRRTA